MAEPYHPSTVRPRARDYLKVFGIAALIALFPAMFLVGGQWWYFGPPATFQAVVAQFLTYTGCILVVLILLVLIRPGKGLPIHFGN